MSRNPLCLLALLAIPGTAHAAVPDAAPTDPGHYVSTIDNPWFPLKPGTVLHYQGSKDGLRAARDVIVTDRTKTVAGVPCLIAEDRVTLGDRPAEKTIGYYAQDTDGNVWYFGEQSQELDKTGKVIKSEGWLAGVDGITPNLIMAAHPAVGDHFLHPYTNARTQVLSLAASVQVPFGTFATTLQIKEWNPSEPDVLSHRFYQLGVGELEDVDVKGLNEDMKLVSVTPTP